MPPKPASIDAYLATVTEEKRAALETLRKRIRAVVPRAEECISYGMPAFRLDGEIVAGFLATARGCSYFPFSGRTLATLAAEVDGYERTKGALHFDPARPLPAALVRKLVAARRKEIAAPASGPRRGTARPRGRGRPAPERPSRSRTR